MTVLSLFPSRVRFVNPDGTLTPEGYRAMQTLFERVGGALGDAGLDTFGIVMAAGSDQGSTQNTDMMMQQASFDATVFYADITQSASQDQFTETTFAPVLPDFLEGTWTPTQGAGLAVVGAFSSSGKYIRIGRQVTVMGVISGATSVATTAAGAFVGALPYTVGSSGTGAAINQANNASAVLVGTGTNIISSAVIAATPSITFSFTYMV